MKKSNLKVGIAYVILGVIFLVFALSNEFHDSKVSSVLFGIMGACFGIGVNFIMKYLRWNSPKHRDYYAEKFEQENIERNDELKEKVRGKSAQYMYAIELYILSISSVIFAVLDAMDIVKNGNLFMFYLTGLLFFQLIAGHVMFRYLLKKY